MYSSTLCSHVNNIYSKLSELQRQIQNHHMHMNQGDTVQIQALDFNSNIEGISSSNAEEKPNELTTQRTLSPTPEVTKPEHDSFTPATTVQQLTSQETDWPDTIPVQIPWVSSSTVQPGERKLSEAKPDITPKVLKFSNWRTILNKSSLLIWTHIWHTTTHMKQANIHIKNTDPIYMT